MSDPFVNNSRLTELAGAVCNGTASQNELAELNSMLRCDKAACHHYLYYCEMHVALRLETRADMAAERACREINVELPTKAPPEVNVLEIASPADSSLTSLAPPIHRTIGYLPSTWPMAYFVATLALGIGLAVMAIIPAHQPTQGFVRSERGVEQPNVVHKDEHVGRITGMVDCQWNDPEKAPSHNTRVSFGQKYVMASGLMEITYDTGAKVVLQGPVTYEVDSKNGGFMPFGKLTGKVESANAKGFTVRTPTVTVTDLGTEFGVEVERDGTCEVHVLKGLVQTEFLDGRGRCSHVVQLTEGEARRYQQKLDRLAAIPVNRPKFQEMRKVNRDDRHLQWLAYIRRLRQDPTLVAYYPFETAGSVPWLLANVTSAGAKLDGSIEGPRWTAGRLPGKAAIRFRGFDSGDKVVLPHQERFNFTGPFSLVVWFKAEQFSEEHQVLIAKGDDTWRLQRAVEDDKLVFGTNHGPQHLVHRLTGRSGVADGQWHMAVAVYEASGATAWKRLYLDGRLSAEEAAPSALLANDQPIWLGNNSARPSDRGFSGWIDEVAIFSRALSASDVQEMYRGGNGQIPADSALDSSKGASQWSPRLDATDARIKK